MCTSSLGFITAALNLVKLQLSQIQQVQIHQFVTYISPSSGFITCKDMKEMKSYNLFIIYSIKDNIKNNVFVP